jgi:PAS domain S-box-containing protein
MKSRYLSYLVKVIVLAAAYYGAAKLAIWTTSSYGSASVIWPSAGIALAALLLWGYGYWPGIALGAALAAGTSDVGLSTTVAATVESTLEALLAAYLLRRFIGFRNALNRLKDVFSLVVLAALLSPMLSALLGAIGICLGEHVPWSEFGSVWLVWWLGDAIGILVVTPVLLTWLDPAQPRPPRRQIAESILQLGLLTIIGLLVFSGRSGTGVNYLPLAFSIFPLMIWAAVRLTPRGTVTATLVLSAVAVWGTRQGHGPFAMPTLTESLLFLQTFTCMVAVTAMVLAAVITERQQAEEMVQESEQRFRQLAENIRQVFWMSDLRKPEMIYISPAYEQVWGQTCQSLYERPRSFLDTVHPADRERVLEAIAAQLRGEETSLEYRIVCPDGSERWVWDRGFPIKDPSGQVYRVAGIAEDITERKQAEEVLRHSEAVNRALLSAIPDLIFRLSQDGTYLDFKAAKDVEPVVPPSEFLGRKITEVLPAEIAQQGLHYISQALQSGETQVFEYQLAQNGEPRDYEARIVVMGEAEVLAIVRDITERKQAERALRESEQRYRQLVELSPDAILVHSEGKVVFANTAAAKLFGLAHPEQFIGQPIMQLVHPDYQGIVEERLRRIRETGEPNPLIEEKLLRLDGGEFYGEVAAIPFIHQGKAAVLVIGRDITERKRIEAELARLNQELTQRLHELQALFDVLPIGVAIAEDPECRHIRANPSFAKMLAITPHDNASLSAPEQERPPIRVFANGKELKGKDLPMQQAAVYGVEIHDLETEVIHADGRVLKLLEHAVPLFDEQGRPRGSVGAFLDITERKRIEEERAQLLEREQAARAEAEAAERRAAFLAEASTTLATSLDYETTLKNVARLVVPTFADACLVTVLEEDGTIRQLAATHADPAKEKLLYEMQERYRLDLNEKAPIHKVLRSGQPEVATEIPDPTLQLIARDREHLELLREIGFKSYLVAPLLAHGRMLGAITLLTGDNGRRYSAADLPFAEDLAYRCALAICNARLYHEAQAANRAKDEFLAIVSHELRTPLTAILGWSRILSSGKLDEAKTAQALAAIDRNAKAQAQLIDDLLDVSRIITNKLQLDLHPIELVPIIEAAIEAVRPAAEAKSIQLEARLDQAAGVVFGDSHRLRQVVWNLLSNAIKFTPSGGRVEIRLLREADQATIIVSDTGQGISPDFLPYVFERFRQADSTTTRAHGGLGLGLAIVRYLVEQHGGSVEAASPGLGQGATFTVKLPILAYESQSLSLRPPLLADDSLSILAGLRVLVVDDEVETCQLLSLMLAGYGAQVKTAASATEALEQLKEWQPDVLLSDLGMPGEDGYELVRKLRASTSGPGHELLAIALSAYAGAETRKQALAAGFQMHLSKPITHDFLASVIANLVKDRQLRAQAQ